mmetsp:Transcript_49738/g.119204  ORF Transcript_49738/g.119204 Transcript_49738/m.119204 type:complete len:480 (+) Transcript_49738:61-1500(+)
MIPHIPRSLLLFPLLFLLSSSASAPIPSSSPDLSPDPSPAGDDDGGSLLTDVSSATLNSVLDNILEIGLHPEAMSKVDVTSLGDSLGFGPKMRRHFTFEQGLVNLNHGSYGATPRIVLRRQEAWRRRMEASPDAWFRVDQYAEMDRVRAEVAEYIGGDAEDVAFVANTSGGVNAVLRSLLRGGGKVLCLNLAYQMVKNALSYIQEAFGEAVVTVEILPPFTQEGVLAAVEAALEANPDVSFAVVDHITSCPAMVLPVEQLVAMLKRKGVKVLVDGAHAIGHVPLDVSALGADFYVSNGHKWLYSPKSSAVLWASKDAQKDLYPTTISGLGKGGTPFQLQFSYLGTSDVTAYVAMGDALSFRRRIGGDAAIMAYLIALSSQGGDLLAARWKTSTLVSGDMAACAMVNVRLPPCDGNATAPRDLPWTLMEEYHTWVPTYQLVAGGDWWVRVSAQVYNGLGDYEMLANAVIAIYTKSCSNGI